MNRRAIMDDLIFFLENRRMDIVNRWADGVMAIPCFKRAENVSREEHLHEMLKFFDVMIEHIVNRRSKRYLKILRELTQRGLLKGFSPSEVVKGHLVLKRVIFDFLSEKYTGNGKTMNLMRSIIDEEIEGHLSAIVESYHQASEKRWRSAQKDLEETKAFLENIFKSSIDGITTLNKKGSITFISKGTEKITGYKQNELIGKHISLYYSGKMEEARKIMKEIREKGELQNYETSIIAKDGSKVPINLSASILKDEKGNIIGTLGIYKDVTEIKKAEEEIRRRNEELSALLEIARAVGSTLELKEVLKIIAQRTAQIIGANRCSINLFQEGNLVPMMSQFADGHKDLEMWAKYKALGNQGMEDVPAYLQAVKTKEPVVINDTSSSTLFPPDRCKTFNISAVLIVPLIFQDKVQGTLNIDQKGGPYIWSKAQIELAMTIANQVSLAIENARLYKSQKERAQEMATLLDVAQAVSSTLDFIQVLKTIALKTAQVCRVDRCTIFLLDEEGRRLLPIMSQFASGRRNEELWRVFKDTYTDLVEDVPVIKRAIHDRKPVIIDDLSRDDLIPMKWIEPFGIKKLAIIPLIIKDRAIGVMNLDYMDERSIFHKDQVDLAVSIGSQVAMTIENARLYQKLKESEERYRDLFENSIDYVYTLDPDGNFTSVNNAIEKFLGYTREELIGNNYRHVIVPGSEEMIYEQFHNIYKTGKPLLDFPIEILKKNGSKAYLETNARLLKKAGKTVGIQCSSKDVTERKKAMEEIRRKNEELESFVYTVSHDLKAPIVSIQGFASILLEDYGERLDEKGRHYLNRIVENTNNMERLIQDLLQLSRIGRVKNVYEIVEASRIVNDVIDELRFQIEEKGVRLVVQEDLPSIQCDRQRLFQVFENLLTNAIKYSSNGKTPEIEIGFMDKMNFFEFYVKDNGIGIDPQYHEKIFRIFYRLNDLEEVEGTGIGLTIVKKIVEAHGGSIRVESKKGEGAAFYFTLPKRIEME